MLSPNERVAQSVKIDEYSDFLVRSYQAVFGTTIKTKEAAEAALRG